MSIRTHISDLCREGRLVCVPPLVAGDPVVRHVFATPEIYRRINPPWETPPDGEVLASLRAMIDQFSVGRVFSFAKEPYNKSKKTFMARIDPTEDQVFDFRCLDPSPGLRAFGRFAEKDVFVMLNIKFRDQFGLHWTFAYMKNWRDERERCKAEWVRLFHAYPPLVRNDLNEYASDIVIV